MSLTSQYSAIGSNVIWLTIFSSPEKVLIKSNLLGLGTDNSLLCATPKDQHLDILTIGLPCQCRSFIDGEIYEFETVIQEILTIPPAIRLKAPQNITQHIPRSFPRLSVDIPGTVRPLNQQGQILSVIPVQLSDLSPTGSQFSIDPSAWPKVSALHLYLHCRLPDFPYHSKFHASIEWIHPTKELMIGIKFLFESDRDIAKQDILKWYGAQRAQFVNTKA